MNNVNYTAEATMGWRFYEHAKLGLQGEIQPHEKNWKEKAGDLGLWTLEKFPGKVWTLMKNPRWITLVLTTISLLSVSYLFYPRITAETLKRVVAAIPLPTWETVKFGTYLFTVGNIIAAALRAEGRFSNKELMDRWYGISQTTMSNIS